MGRPRFLALLNSLARCLDDEIYLEIGTHQGGSLIGALLNNNAKAVSVDDFSEYQEAANKEILFKWLQKFGVRNRVTFYELEFKAFFALNVIPEKSVGLYYYDGAHDRESTYNGLELGYPLMVDNGIILLDDTIWSSVREGINDFLGMHPEDIRIMLALTPTEKLHPDWWNGTIALQKLK